MLNNLYQKYKDCGLTVLGIAAGDDAEESRRVIKQRSITYPQLLNTGNQYSEAYGILGLPYAILFAPDGKNIARDIRGDDIEKKLSHVYTHLAHLFYKRK